MRTHFLVKSFLFAGLAALLFLAGSLSAAPLNVSIDFDTFTGAGFDPAPTAGQLDSDTWSVLGMSDGDLLFGGTETTGDFARGQSTGGVTTGGVYAFDVGSGDVIFGVQPVGTDFTPGSITLRMANNSGGTVNAVDVSYDIWYRNDQGRANSLNLSYSTDNSAYTDVPALDFTTPEAADPSPAWAVAPQSTTLTGLSIPDGGLFYLRWTGDDVSGSGSRDEYGIDDVTVSALDPTAVTLSTAHAVTPAQPGVTAVVLALVTLSLFALARQRRRPT